MKTKEIEYLGINLEAGKCDGNSGFYSIYDEGACYFNHTGKTIEEAIDNSKKCIDEFINFSPKDLFELGYGIDHYCRIWNSDTHCFTDPRLLNIFLDKFLNSKVKRMQSEIINHQ